MKHIMGNSPKCCECKYYREKEADEPCMEDGFCTIGHTAINGKKKKVEKIAVSHNWDCDYWIDAENDLIGHYEAIVHKADPRKPELVAILTNEVIQTAITEQRAKRRRKREDIYAIHQDKARNI